MSLDSSVWDLNQACQGAQCPGMPSEFLSHLGQDDASISDQSSISRAAGPNSGGKKEQGPWEP